MADYPIVLVWPTDVISKVVQGFGIEDTDPEYLPLYRSLGYLAHNGYDIAPRDSIPPGIKPVYASTPGIVTVQYNDPTAGNFVILEHPQVRTRYLHLHGNPLVVTGQEVNSGQLLGFMGNSGLAEGVHLHWDVRPAEYDFQNGYKGLVSPGHYWIKFRVAA